MHVNDTHSDDASDDDLAWILVPAILGLLLYLTLVLFTWPYTRRGVGWWVLLLCILIPPLFPFLLLFVFLPLCYVPVVPGRQEVYVVQPQRGRVTVLAPPVVVEEVAAPRAVMRGSGV